MKRPYSVGLAVSVGVAIGSIGLKAAFTKYPGLGDFMLFSAFVELLPRRVIEGIYALDLDLRVISYLGKAFLASVVFTSLHFGLRKWARLQSPVSIGVTSVALAAMSLGQAVVA